jgi:hypothetical protein
MQWSTYVCMYFVNARRRGSRDVAALGLLLQLLPAHAQAPITPAPSPAPAAPATPQGLLSCDPIIDPSTNKPANKYVFDAAEKKFPEQCLLDPNDPDDWKPCVTNREADRIWRDVFPIPTGRLISPHGRDVVVPGTSRCGAGSSTVPACSPCTATF